MLVYLPPHILEEEMYVKPVVQLADSHLPAPARLHWTHPIEQAERKSHMLTTHRK